MSQTLNYRLCAALLQARQAQGLSEEELAGRIEREPGFIREYERGRRPLMVEELLVIADALDLNPSTLLHAADAADRNGHLPSPKRYAR